MELSHLLLCVCIVPVGVLLFALADHIISGITYKIK